MHFEIPPIIDRTIDYIAPVAKWYLRKRESGARILVRLSSRLDPQRHPDAPFRRFARLQTMTIYGRDLLVVTPYSPETSYEDAHRRTARENEVRRCRGENPLTLIEMTLHGAPHVVGGRTSVDSR